jgi:pyrroline-5-carboxylate reductase
MTTPVIAFIGAGNMGGSLIGGLINDGHPAAKIWACDPSEERLLQLRDTYQINISDNNNKAIQAADVVIFAVKPQLFAGIAKACAAVIQDKKPLVISIAAGIREESIQQWLGGDTAIVRTMPNTPALVGCGATALFANKYVNPDRHALAESILRAVGIIVWVDKEEMMDTVTALSGSGPAYFFLMMESLQQAAEQQGLSSDNARLLTLQTALGAARMAIESGKPLDELRHNVTSPGGTTEKAVSVLEDNNIRGLFTKALQAAKQRSEELAALLEK